MPKYEGARIFQGNELLVFAIKLFDAGRLHAERGGSDDDDRRATVTRLVREAETKIPTDEPFFLLLGRDRYAPTGIGRYARVAEERGAPVRYVDEIVDLACAMEDWQEAHKERVKRPD